MFTKGSLTSTRFEWTYTTSPHVATTCRGFATKIPGQKRKFEKFATALAFAFDSTERICRRGRILFSQSTGLSSLLTVAFGTVMTALCLECQIHGLISGLRRFLGTLRATNIR